MVQKVFGVTRGLHEDPTGGGKKMTPYAESEG